MKMLFITRLSFFYFIVHILSKILILKSFNAFMKLNEICMKKSLKIIFVLLEISSKKEDYNNNDNYNNTNYSYLFNLDTIN